MNCSNPNCQAQNIPNEAIYCPVCGKLLEKYLPASHLFTDAYRNLVEQRANLYAERQSFLLFQHERNTLYETLNKFDNFQSETEEFIKLMKKTKFKKSIKEPENFIPWITCTCMLVLTLFFFFQGVSISLDQDEIGMFWFWNTFRALTLGTLIGSCIGFILFGLCYLYLEYVAEPDDIDIFHKDSHYYKKYVVQYIEPFIDECKNIYYRQILDCFWKEHIIESELCTPNKITIQIQQQIKHIENQITDVENELKILTSA